MAMLIYQRVRSIIPELTINEQEFWTLLKKNLPIETMK
jgi:hypothetical protein